MNFIAGTVDRGDDRCELVTSDGTALPVPASAAARDGQPVIYGVRPEHLILASAGDGFAAEILVVEPTGAQVQLQCRFADHEVKVVTAEGQRFTPGERIALKPMLKNVHLFDTETEERLPD